MKNLKMSAERMITISAKTGRMNFFKLLSLFLKNANKIAISVQVMKVEFKKVIIKYRVFVVFLLLISLFFKIYINLPLIVEEPNQEYIVTPSSSLYFIHGYGGNNSQFDDLLQCMEKSSFSKRHIKKNVHIHFFDYFKKYYAINMTLDEIHNIKGGISTYATDFFELLNSNYYSSTQIDIDIVAHSLGGLIVREMLRLYSTQLRDIGINIARVITLGTPHLGSDLSNNPLVELIIGSDCDNQVINSMAPDSDFITLLNRNPESYMSNIEWYFIAGINLNIFPIIIQELVFSGVPGDGIVDWKSALAVNLDFEPESRVVLYKDHNQLIFDPKNKESYSYIRRWLIGDFPTRFGLY